MKTNNQKLDKPKVVLDFQSIRNSILFFFLVLIGILVVYKLLPIFLILFFTFIITSAVKPTVIALEKRIKSRTIAIIVVYTILIVLFITVIGFIVTPFATQTNDLVQALPTVFQKMWANLTTWFQKIENITGESIYNIEEVQETIKNTVSDYLTNFTFVTTIQDIGGYLFYGLLAFVLSIYMIISHDEIINGVLFIIPWDKRRQKIRSLILEVESNLGKWLLGQLISMFIIGVEIFIGLSLIGLPFAFPLAVAAGLLEIIPNVGGLVFLIIAAPLALIYGGPIKMVLVIVLYLLINAFQNMVVVPRVMNKAVGINSFLVLLSVLIGMQLAGAFGALLAVPLVVVLQIAIKYLREYQSDK